MPNTPAMVGRGITVWTGSDTLKEVQKYQTQGVLRSFGDEVFVLVYFIYRKYLILLYKRFMLKPKIT